MRTKKNPSETVTTGNLHELNFKQLGWILSLNSKCLENVKQKFLLDHFFSVKHYMDILSLALNWVTRS